LWRTVAFEGKTTTSRAQRRKPEKKWIHLDWKTYQTARRKESTSG